MRALPILLLALLLTGCAAQAAAVPRATLTPYPTPAPVTPGRQVWPTPDAAYPAPQAGQPDPPRLTIYGVAGGTCATATGADAITADPPGEQQPGEALTLCWPEPPRRVTATGPGGVATWPSDVPAPTPLPTRPQPTSAPPVEWPARQILNPMLNG